MGTRVVVTSERTALRTFVALGSFVTVSIFAVLLFGTVGR